MRKYCSIVGLFDGATESIFLISISHYKQKSIIKHGENSRPIKYLRAHKIRNSDPAT